jgi:hypothetical protein
LVFIFTNVFPWISISKGGGGGRCMACAHATSMNRLNTPGLICHTDFVETLDVAEKGRGATPVWNVKQLSQFLVLILSNSDTATTRVNKAYDTMWISEESWHKELAQFWVCTLRTDTWNGIITITEPCATTWKIQVPVSTLVTVTLHSGVEFHANLNHVNLK